MKLAEDKTNIGDSFVLPLDCGGILGNLPFFPYNTFFLFHFAESVYERIGHR